MSPKEARAATMRRIVETREAELTADAPVRPHGLWNTKSKTYYALTRYMQRRYENGR